MLNNKSWSCKYDVDHCDRRVDRCLCYCALVLVGMRRQSVKSSIWDGISRTCSHPYALLSLAFFLGMAKWWSRKPKTKEETYAYSKLSNKCSVGLEKIQLMLIMLVREILAMSSARQSLTSVLFLVFWHDIIQESMTLIKKANYCVH